VPPDQLKVSPNKPLLEVRNLHIDAVSLSFNEGPQCTPVVEGVSFAIQRGRVLGLIGESGAGKSTVGLATLGYTRPGLRVSRGQVLIDGTSILELPPRELRRIRGARATYVAQSAAAAFNPSRRIGEQVIEAAVYHGISEKRAALKRAKELFELLGLEDPESFAGRYPHQVSGGQLQRAMIAMALCPGPDIIVFDEPTTALDSITQIDVLAAIRSAISQSGVSALYITHDLALVAQVADDILVLRKGRVVEYGRTAQIISEPSREYTQRLMAVKKIARKKSVDLTEPILKVEKVNAAYKRSGPVLFDVTIDLPRARTLAIVGQSGSGKSTLGRVITGLLPPTAGTIYFNDRRLAGQLTDRSNEDLRQLQMIHQNPDLSLNPNQTIGEIIGRPLEFYFGLGGQGQVERIKKLLEQVELPYELLNRYPTALSGGQKQRVSIARALAANPSLIICDEPTSALDPLIADGILRLLSRLQVEVGMSYVFITHDIAIVRAISDFIGVLHRGRVVRFGPKSEVLSPPFDDYTYSLLSSSPKLELGWLDRLLEGRATGALAAARR